jgi:UTP-glucose-1-phosphate uridylyltransferase
MKPTLLILAAGMGSRYGSLKQIDGIGPSSETIMDYSVYDAIRAGFGKVVFVIRKSFEKDFLDNIFIKYKDKIAVEYVFQELDALPEGYTVPTERQKPWGTGHAVLVAASKIKEPFCSINADDFYGYGAFKVMADFLMKPEAGNITEFAMAGYQLGNTLSEYGTVSRGVCRTDESGYLTDVYEHTKIQKHNNKIVYTDESDRMHELNKNAIVSMNFWGFTPVVFQYLEKAFTDFLQENQANPKAELYMPMVVDNLIKEKKAKAKVLNCNEQWFGITYKEDKALVVLKISELVEKGVYPTRLW